MHFPLAKNTNQSCGSHAHPLEISEQEDLWNRESCTKGCNHTSTNAPDPIRTLQLSVLGREARVVLGWVSFRENSAVKSAWARVVLGLVTSREVLVLHPFLFFLFRSETSIILETP
ncbi:hypothetical protein Bca4012_026693 [Brassica carinata]